MEHAEEKLLYRRADDMIRQSGRGEVTVSPFLTPREANGLKNYLRGRGLERNCFFWGGYRDAERTRLFLLPGYLREFLDAPSEPDLTFGTSEWGNVRRDRSNAEGVPVDLIDAYTDGAVSEAVSALFVKGSGYRDLTHRDYLGSLLALGIKREAVGDILPDGEYAAVLFCTGQMSGFIRENLRRVATDAVKVTAYDPPADFSGGKRYLAVNATVASERLDCVVGALTGMSRETAQNAVKNGLCEVDFEPEQKPDRMLTPPCQISVRGYGRFVLRGFDGETRKGRLRMRADKFV